MEFGGAMPAGAGRHLRLDPFALPVRFPARDAGADGQMRQIELDRDRVVLRRAVHGMRMKIRLPLDAFIGVTLTAETDDASSCSITLDHVDPALSIPLLDSTSLEEAAAVWKAWGRVLGISIRICDAAGNVIDTRPGRRDLQAAPAMARRRRRSVMRKRRPAILMRRKPGRHIGLSVVHRDEREIIARN